MKIIIAILLLIVSIIDIKTKLIDSRLNILILIVGLFNHLSLKELILCLLLPFTLFVLNKINKKEVIGYGDIELLFCLSFFLGYRLQVISFFIATIVLFIYSLFKKEDKIAFAPFISIGTFICMFKK